VRSRPFLISLVMAVLMAGCAAHPTVTPPSPPNRWPANLSEFHFVWTAEPGIDLLTGPAVIARAYTESSLLASFGGSLDYLYPGFDRAVDKNQPVGAAPRSTIALWPEPDPEPTPSVGTAREHILRIDQKGNDVAVVSCYWTVGTALQQSNGQYRIKGNPPPYTGVYVNRVDLQAPPAPQGLPPQRGPSSYPLTDVFGRWRVIGSLHPAGSTDLQPEWPEYTQDLDACTAKSPEPLERREYLTSADRPRSDFPTLPASPGWPVASQ
jgi:hypothetical protein